MKRTKVYLLCFLPLLCTACIKEEPLNNECDILNAWVEGEAYISYFYQTSQMRQENISSNNNTIIFSVRSVDSLPLMPVFFSLSPGATITPASGSLQDFSQGPVTYTVRSEDGQWMRSYRVGFQSHNLAASLFSFEHVDIKYSESNGSSYHIFYEVDSTGVRNDIWASGNAGVALINQGWTPELFPTHSTDDGYLCRGVCLQTKYAGDLAAMMNKPIAAGNLFLGQFNVNAVLTNALKATEFGIAVDKQPKHVSGWYRYRPGEIFTNAQMETLPGRLDEGHIYGVFYRNQDAAGNRVILDGSNILTSENIVSLAQVATLPATDEWSHFEMTFEGGIADPAVLAARGYSFTIVFSSSKNGDLFEGAIGSTLYIDEVEVEFMGN